MDPAALFALPAPRPGLRLLPERRWLFVPLRGIPTYFYYAPRRVNCSEHGVVLEHIPWSDGKRPVTCTMMEFLARRAQRLGGRETAWALQTSWEAVYRSVERFVEWGFAHCQLSGWKPSEWTRFIGRLKRADNFLTVLYQIDAPCRRLLWVGRPRSQVTLRQGLEALGPEVVQGPRFVCSDMWKPYLLVIAAEAGQASHILDRFHITGHLNQPWTRCAALRARAYARRVNPPPSDSNICAGPCCAVAVGFGHVPGKSSMLCSPASWPPHGPGI